MSWTLRGAIRRTVQVLLCASAIAGGAWLAHATYDSPARSVVGVFPPPMPDAVLEELEPAQIPPEPREIREPARARTTSFGRELSDGQVMSGATPHRMILFTFDDGPD